MSVESTLDALGVAQVIVTLKSVPLGAGAAMTAASPAMSDVTRHFRTSEESQPGALAAANAGRHASKAALEGGKVQAPPACRVYNNLGLVLGTIDKEGLAGLKSDPEVDTINEAPHVSLIRPVSAEPAAAATGPTWGIKRLKVDQVWARGFTGKGVLVGHLDTGVDGKHPALKTAIQAFAEFDAIGNEVQGAKPRDSDEHGTHTAGTICGRPVNGSKFGVAPGAKLASAMVIEGGDVIARILGGMDWIVGKGAKILSMSLGLRGFRNDFLPLMQAIRNRGILPVIAVGNEGPGTSRSPGNYDIVLSVGASDNTDRVASFSSSQRIVRTNDPRVPDIAAPGVDVLSAVPGNRFAMMDGSSMATPHIAGLAALLWEAKPGASAKQIEAAIFDSCTLPASMPASRANRGVPDAMKALSILLGTSLSDLKPAKKAARKTAKKGTKKSPKKGAKKTAKAAKKKAAPVKKSAAKKKAVKKAAKKKP